MESVYQVPKIINVGLNLLDFYIHFQFTSNGSCNKNIQK